MKIVTLGADPEFFVLDDKGKPYPAVPFTTGTKDNPIPIKELGEGFFEQRDNLSLEGNVPPAYSKEEFIYNITALREFFLKRVAEFGYSISPSGIEHFPQRMLNIPEANEFGCSNVTSSWDSNEKSFFELRTPSLSHVKYRLSGFHVHIGIELTEEEKQYPFYWSILIGRLFDIFLTLPSHNIRNEPERLLTYGKYGMIRSKSYGVECRTLSSFFTQKEYLPWVWDQIMKIQDFINMCSKNDLINFTKYGYVVHSYYSILKVLGDMLFSIENKSILTQFDETKNIRINNDRYARKQKYRYNNYIVTSVCSSGTTTYTTTF